MMFGKKGCINAIVAAVAIGVMTTISACGGGSGSNPNASNGGTEKFSIAMSNNDASLSWRQQMLNGAQHLADTKFADTVDYELRQTENTVSAQVASIQQLIRQKPDAILVDAASDTALNSVLKQACDAGIVVVNFDQIASGVDCTYKLAFPSEQQASDAASWMCKQLGGSGNVVLDQAIAGLPIPEMQNNAVKKVFSEQCPGVKVVGNYQSKYSPGPEMQAISSQLTGNNEINGVVSLAYCSSVIEAFANAGKEAVPTTCVAANSNAIACEKGKVPCFMFASTPIIASIALDKAVQILQGKDQPKTQDGFSQTYVMNSGTDFEHKLPLKEMVSGEDYFPEASPDLILPVTTADYGITPAIATTGKK